MFTKDPHGQKTVRSKAGMQSLPTSTPARKWARGARKRTKLDAQAEAHKGRRGLGSGQTSYGKTPSSRGKPRAERTIQTYARSVRAFFGQSCEGIMPCH
ncbi:MAG TPA: hypothetical protein VJ761_22455 [Ktedonobacteraceae bacterium]|nr:hypothetical protein [Ktedonobacteraceae bacterium]